MNEEVENAADFAVIEGMTLEQNYWEEEERSWEDASVFEMGTISTSESFFDVAKEFMDAIFNLNVIIILFNKGINHCWWKPWTTME